MDEPTLVSVLISWFPILLLIAVWLFFIFRSFKQTKAIYSGDSGKSHGQMLEENVAETKRMNDLLEKMLSDHEQRLMRLEQAYAERQRPGE